MYLESMFTSNTFFWCKSEGSIYLHKFIVHHGTLQIYCTYYIFLYVMTLLIEINAIYRFVAIVY
jgi:hypothetical protein